MTKHTIKKEKDFVQISNGFLTSNNISLKAKGLFSLKERFLSINSEHMEYIIESMNKNTSKITNIKQYMLAGVFNAPNTMDNFYKMRVNYDLNRYA